MFILLANRSMFCETFCDFENKNSNIIDYKIPTSS